MNISKEFGMTKITSTATYERRLKKFKKHHPELKTQYAKTIRLLEKNPHHPSLRLHNLKGKLSDYHSVSINIQYRIMLDFVIRDDMVILIDVGNHDYLYRKRK